jgi:hypothetical protein
MNNLSAFTTEDTTTMPSKGQSPHPTMPEIKINTNGVGTTLACFQYTEILPLSIDSWKTNDKNGDSSFDKLFKK